MIRHFSYDKIEREKWDSCIVRSVNSRIYGYSWFLDIVADHWEGLVEDDYAAVFPLVKRNKMGINYLYQPYFTQQLGLFSELPSSSSKTEQFLEAIPETIRFAEIQLNSGNSVSERYTSKLRKNHELDLSLSYHDLKARYNQNTRRNLKKAEEHDPELKNDLMPGEMVSFFRKNYGNEEGKLSEKDYYVVEKLMTEALERKAGGMRAVFAAGNLCAALFFLKDEKRIIYHLAATSHEGKEKGSMFFLVDQLIKEFAERRIILDFEGSDNENVSRFYKGFGAKETLYPLVRINRLSFITGKLVMLVKKIRRR